MKLKGGSYLTRSLFTGDQNAMAEKASMWLFYKLNVFMNENTIFAILTEKHRLFFIVMLVKVLYLVIRFVRFSTLSVLLFIIMIYIHNAVSGNFYSLMLIVVTGLFGFLPIVGLP